MSVFHTSALFLELPPSSTWEIIVIKNRSDLQYHRWQRNAFAGCALSVLVHLGQSTKGPQLLATAQWTLSSLWARSLNTVIGNSSNKISFSISILLKFKGRFGPLHGLNPAESQGPDSDLCYSRWELTLLQLIGLDPHVSHAGITVLTSVELILIYATVTEIAACIV